MRASRFQSEKHAQRFHPQYSTTQTYLQAGQHPLQRRIDITFSHSSRQLNRSMAQDICKKLHQIEKDIFSLREIGSLEKLHDRASNILTQISIQKSLDEIVELLRGGKSLPVRRIGFNIKKLCDGTEESNSRWQRLQALDLDAFILCTVSFPRIASLPAEQFTWLVNNANRYLEAQALPPNWIRSDQVRKVLANTPRKENTVQFLEGI